MIIRKGRAALAQIAALAAEVLALNSRVNTAIGIGYSALLDFRRIETAVLAAGDWLRINYPYLERAYWAVGRIDGEVIALRIRNAELEGRVAALAARVDALDGGAPVTVDGDDGDDSGGAAAAGGGDDAPAEGGSNVIEAAPFFVRAPEAEEPAAA